MEEKNGIESREGKVEKTGGREMKWIRELN